MIVPKKNNKSIGKCYNNKSNEGEPLIIHLTQHIRCYRVGGDNIIWLYIEVLFIVLDVLKAKQKPQIEISVSANVNINKG